MKDEKIKNCGGDNVDIMTYAYTTDVPKNPNSYDLGVIYIESVGISYIYNLIYVKYKCVDNSFIYLIIRPKHKQIFLHEDVVTSMYPLLSNLANIPVTVKSLREELILEFDDGSLNFMDGFNIQLSEIIVLITLGITGEKIYLNPNLDLNNLMLHSLPYKLEKRTIKDRSAIIYVVYYAPTNSSEFYVRCVDAFLNKSRTTGKKLIEEVINIFYNTSRLLLRERSRFVIKTLVDINKITEGLYPNKEASIDFLVNKLNNMTTIKKFSWYELSTSEDYYRDISNDLIKLLTYAEEFKKNTEKITKIQAEKENEYRKFFTTTGTISSTSLNYYSEILKAETVFSGGGGS